MKKKEQYALISTYNKIHLGKICEVFDLFNIKIISTGSTAQSIKNLGYKCIPVSSITKFKEILDGRVKTLHPKIHASLLYDRDNKEHKKVFDELNFPSINFVVVNLYPFEESLKQNKKTKELIEMIDIGGPTMLRSAAKNFKFVTTIIDPGDYDSLVKNLIKKNGKTDINYRKKLAEKVFEKTSSYDQSIFLWLAGKRKKNINFEDNKKITLKYGENPNQKSYYYKEKKNSFIDYKIQGKEIGYNNILDLSSGTDCINEFSEPTCIIIKHNNPCGASSRRKIIDAFIKAYEADPLSAFGGIVLLNRKVDKNLANVISKKFFEAIAAPSFSKEAKNILKEREKLILIKTKNITLDNKNDIKSVVGGYLIQEKNIKKILKNNLINVSDKKVNKALLEDLVFALKICKHVKSNAIVLAKNKQTFGIGAGQMSRVDSTDIAIKKIIPQNQNKKYVAASDAFFPFTDNIKKLLKNKCEAIVQPSGSINDKKIIDFAKKNNLPLYFINFRLFKH